MGRSGRAGILQRAPRLRDMTTDEIRARFLDYFESQDHRRLPLVPPRTTRRRC